MNIINNMCVPYLTVENGKSEHNKWSYNSLLQVDNNIITNNNNVVTPKVEETKRKEEDDSSFEQFNVVNDLVTVSERILDDLDTTSSTYTTHGTNPIHRWHVCPRHIIV
jgi:hypothetical protein